MPFLLALLFLFTNFSHALDVPAHTSLAIDLTGTLTPTEQRKLHESLLSVQYNNGPQIQLLVIPTLDGDALESYSLKVVEQYELGDKERDDGVLLLIALKERKLRIEVGQGLEGVLPDITAGRIIRDVIVPYFKDGDIRGGIYAGLDAISKTVGKTIDGIPKKYQNNKFRNSVKFYVIKIIFILIIFGFLFLPPIIHTGSLGTSRHRYRGRGGYGGGFGGGFGGGGGGGFSGGGSSGGW